VNFIYKKLRKRLTITVMFIYCRVMEGNQSIGAKEAKAFYDKLWKCLIDARTADRKNRMKSKIDPNRKLKVQKH
jgi:hypothetical protein